jgi:hypothetical protein
MGIDIYLRWALMTEEEEEAQLQGYNVCIGHTGYLREAYHGDPYATKLLVPEAFAAGGEPVHIPAAVLRERLPSVMRAALHRERRIYNTEANEDSLVVQSFVDFVNLAEELEKRGRKPVVFASY